MRKGVRRTLLILGIVAVVADRRAPRGALRRRALREPAARRHGRVPRQRRAHRPELDPRRLRAAKSPNREDRRGARDAAVRDDSRDGNRVQWRALFRGSAVGEIIMHSPQLNLVQSQANDEKQLGTGVNWPQEIRDLFPFQFNLVEARDGLVTFRAPGISTNDSLTMRNFTMQLRNLTNVQDRRGARVRRSRRARADHGQCADHADGQHRPERDDADVRHRPVDRRRAARRREPLAARVPEGRRRDGRLLDVRGARGRRRPVRRLRAADPRGSAIRLARTRTRTGRSAKPGKGS